ncbi:uncharacterized protein LOC135477613 [Liolophura sinensis]|uniref:uncharacterized protein LOC135477613 n=1 Tax=Liolophura sinensis TaxID=3198878 RepID=UPI0031596362
MLEYPTQEEAEEIVQYSEKFQARIGNSNLKLTILGQTKIPSGNEMTPVEPAVQAKSDKGYPHSDTGSTRTKTLTEFKSAQVKQTVKPKYNKNDSVKADSSTKLVPKKVDTKVTKVSEKEKNDPKKVSKSTDSGKRTSVKESGKDKKAHRKEKLSDSSKKSNSKDDFNRGNNKTRRDSKQSGSTSRRSERWSPGRSSRSHRSTSSSRKSQESRSSDKKKVSSSSEKGRSSSKSVDKPKHKDTKPQTDGKKTDLNVTGKKVSENQGRQKTNATSGEKKKSGTIIPVQLGRTGNAAKRPMETSVNINRSDKRSRFDVPTTGPGPVGPYPIGMNPGSGGPMMRGNFPQQQPHVVRPPVPPNMMNLGMGRMPSQNFSPQNMMMGQSQPMTQSVSQPMPQPVSQPMPQPVSQPGMNTNMGPSGVPCTGAPGLDQPMMGPMYMGPRQMNRQQQGYVMDNRNPSNWPPNRNSGNMANNWDKSGGGRGESPEEIHNLRGELLKQLQVLETGNVSDPSDLSYIAQKLKQVQQSRNQGGFTGPQQGGFPRGPQGNHQQPQTGPQQNVQGSFENAPNINQQGNFPSQPNMQQQQAVYRDWPSQSSGAAPQGDPSNQYGYQSYSNNNLQSSMPYEGKQMHGDNSGMRHPGGMDSYNISRGSGMPGGMPPYNSDRGVDRRDISVSQLKKLKTICVQNLPKPINYIEVKKFIRKEMVSRNLCNPKGLASDLCSCIKERLLQYCV